MNKAFVREPEDDGKAFCPCCRSLGIGVDAGPLDTHIRTECRGKLSDYAWFCSYQHCVVAYFNQFEVIVAVDDLKATVYPKDLDAPICACFGFTYDEVEADSKEDVPVRIRELLRKSKTGDAHCQTLAADGRCCMTTVQSLYMKLRSQS
jgi:hypothetical protein